MALSAITALSCTKGKEGEGNSQAKFMTNARIAALVTTIALMAITVAAGTIATLAAGGTHFGPLHTVLSPLGVLGPEAIKYMTAAGAGVLMLDLAVLYISKVGHDKVVAKHEANAAKKGMVTEAERDAAVAEAVASATRGMVTAAVHDAAVADAVASATRGMVAAAERDAAVAAAREEGAAAGRAEAATASTAGAGSRRGGRGGGAAAGKKSKRNKKG